MARSDPNQIAHAVVRQIIDEAENQPEKNPAAVALGRLGGQKGGVARAASLSAKRRKEIARQAAEARWGKPRS